MPKYRDCTTPNGLELYIVHCDVMRPSLIIYIRKTSQRIIVIHGVCETQCYTVQK